MLWRGAFPGLNVRQKTIFSLVTTVTLIMTLEFALRLALPTLRTASLPGKMIAENLRGGGLKYDPDLYWYWPRLPIPHLELNQHGFRRSKPMTVVKPREVVRVVTLGDSQTWGAFHSQAESYGGVAEELLGPGWEILNAAVPGYRSLNVYRLLQRRIERFVPDVIVVDCMAFDSARDDGPIQQPPLGVGVVRRLLWHSRIYYALRHLMASIRASVPHKTSSSTSPLINQGDGNHDLIKAWAEARGIKVLFVDYPVMIEQDQLACSARPRHLPDGAEVFSACTTLRRSGEQVADLFHDHNHLTVLGNRLVGSALAGRLRELIRK